MVRSGSYIKNEQGLIFLHIPKAAGSTIWQLFERHYEPTASVVIEGSRIRECIAEFEKLPEAQRGRIRFIRGHMPFGLHNAVPRPFTYVALMRDPIERIISRYYYTLRRPDDYLYDAVVSQNWSLRDFVRSGISTELDNGQTRLLSGVGSTIPFGQCTSEVLTRAKKNIQEHFAVVGFTERFDETLAIINKVFGWRTRFYVRRNVTKGRPRKEEIARDVFDLIEKHNELDIELYRYALGLFEELINRQGQGFERRLRAFKLLESLYVRIYALARPVGRRIMKLARN